MSFEHSFSDYEIYKLVLEAVETEDPISNEPCNGNEDLTNQSSGDNDNSVNVNMDEDGLEDAPLHWLMNCFIMCIS